jgi:hypothetical protein
VRLSFHARRRWLIATPIAAALVAAAPGSATAASSHVRISAAEQSTNWSGYGTNVTETGVKKVYKSVSGKWIVPAVSQQTPGQSENTSTWIGIGGNVLNPLMPVGDPTLIQTGTEQDVAANGTTSYSAWWEILPEPETPIPAMKVQPGDVMSAMIKQGSTPENWKITLTDLTRHQSFSKTTAYPSLMDTAEWIHEAPTLIGVNGGIATLAKSAPVQFGAAAVNSTPVNLNKADQIQMTDNNGTVIAQPSRPDSSNRGFNVCVYSGTSCAAPTTPLL